MYTTVLSLYWDAFIESLGSYLGPSAFLALLWLICALAMLWLIPFLRGSHANKQRNESQSLAEQGPKQVL
jgi:hypothetical protein